MTLLEKIDKGIALYPDEIKRFLWHSDEFECVYEEEGDMGCFSV